LVKKLPEECFGETYEKLLEFKDKAEKSRPVACLRCGANGIVRNGKRNGRQAYLCKSCGKTSYPTELPR
jgi:transposase-like protein